jgi:hypothetical protein
MKFCRHHGMTSSISACSALAFGPADTVIKILKLRDTGERCK